MRWIHPYLLVALAASAHAQTVLSDFTIPGEWQPDAWSRVIPQLDWDKEAPEGCTGSLAVHLTFPGVDQEFRWVALQPAVADPIPFRVTSVSVWVKGAGINHGLDLIFKDAKDKDVKVPLGGLTHTGWKQLTAKLPDGATGPLKLAGFNMNNWEKRGAADYTFNLARLEIKVDRNAKLAEPADNPSLHVYMPEPLGLTPADGKGVVTVALTSWRADPINVELRPTLTDWTGAATKLPPVKAAVTGEWRQGLSVVLPRFGSYRLTLEAVRDGKPFASITRRIARAPEPLKLTDAQRLASAIGVNTHHQSIWPALGRIGVHWARDYSFTWLAQGKEAPIGNGIDMSGKTRAAEAAGVIVLPIAMNAFRKPDGGGFITNEGTVRGGFEKMARAFPEVPAWELDNEADLGMPGLHFDLPNYEQYIAAASRGIRGGSKAQVVLNGTSGIHFEETVALLKSPVKAAFDVVNSHYYTGTVAPEIAVEDANIGGAARRVPLRFIDQLRRINRVSRDAGKESWLTEIGYDTDHGPAVGERLQALWLARAYLLCRWSGDDKIFWFFDRDAEGDGIFSTCGLFDLQWGPRPSAVAMAALSHEIATAEPGGRIDLGPNTWCVPFKQSAAGGGGWTVAAWTVEQPAPLPAELAKADAVDVFGNPAKPAQLGPDVHYFHLATLPPAWEAQRKADLLGASALTVAPGGTAAVTIEAPGATVSWSGVPAGLTATPWAEKDGRFTSTLTAAPTLGDNSLTFRAVAAGTGWRREWPVTVYPVPALRVEGSTAWEPDVTATLRLRASDPAGEGEIKLTVAPEQGAIYPPTLRARPDRDQTAVFQPAATAHGAVPIVLELSNGARQTVFLRPKGMTAPRIATPKIDGDLADAPAASKLDSRVLVGMDPDAVVGAWFAWTPDGLYLAAELPVNGLKPTRPEAFWDGSNLEFFWETPNGQTRQEWFCPVKDGAGWKLHAGEWKRSDAIPASIDDDKRPVTAMRPTKTGLALEVLLPNAMLGDAAPAANKVMRCLLSMQGVDAVGRVARASWPVGKDEGLRDAGTWGLVRFGQ